MTSPLPQLGLTNNRTPPSHCPSPWFLHIWVEEGVQELHVGKQFQKGEENQRGQSLTNYDYATIIINTNNTINHAATTTAIVGCLCF